jgi:uncharacterized protein YmfQ (DUF2313 family)
MVVATAQRAMVPNYASGMVGWRDERVRAAEEALRSVVRTADDVLKAVTPEDEPPAPLDDDQPSVLRDAW